MVPIKEDRFSKCHLKALGQFIDVQFIDGQFISGLFIATQLITRPYHQTLSRLQFLEMSIHLVINRVLAMKWAQCYQLGSFTCNLRDLSHE
jgi:hypothetical protein